jgi:hypothetical protein
VNEGLTRRRSGLHCYMGGDTLVTSGRAGARLPGGRITRIRRSSSLTAAAVTSRANCVVSTPSAANPWWYSPGAMDVNLEALDSCFLAVSSPRANLSFEALSVHAPDQAARLRWGD